MDPDANIIFGTVVDESLGEQVRVTVIATGLDENDSDSLPTLDSVSSSRSSRPTSRPSTPATRTSAPARSNAGSRTNSSSNANQGFDIPDFLKHSRM